MEWNKTSEILPKCMTLCLVAYDGPKGKQIVDSILCHYIGGHWYHCITHKDFEDEAYSQYWAEIKSQNGDNKVAISIRGKESDK